MTETESLLTAVISKTRAILIALPLSIALSGCIGGGDDGPENYPQQAEADDDDGHGLTDILPIPGFGKKKDHIPGGTSPVLGVNKYFWRATLDTLSFMPLQSADPSGGVIITDWYADPQAPEERFKVTVYILDQRLRADGIKVSVFKQEKRGNTWTDAAVDPETPSQLENAILTKARQLRVAQMEN